MHLRPLARYLARHNWLLLQRVALGARWITCHARLLKIRIRPSIDHACGVDTHVFVGLRLNVILVLLQLLAQLQGILLIQVQFLGVLLVLRAAGVELVFEVHLLLLL